MILHILNTIKKSNYYIQYLKAISLRYGKYLIQMPNILKPLKYVSNNLINKDRVGNNNYE